jgi:hypothetical protein
VVKNAQTSQVLVAHICNPSYSGGSNQEDRGLKTAQANSSYLGKPFTNIGLKVKALSSSHSTAKEKKKKNLQIFV